MTTCRRRHDTFDAAAAKSQIELRFFSVWQMPDFSLMRILGDSALVKASEHEAAAESARSMLSDMPPGMACGTCIIPAASAGDPRGNKLAKDAANAAGLNRAQRRQLHDLITGQGITNFQEILQIAKDIAAGNA